MRTTRGKRRAFTLLEMMIVVGIFGILLTAVLMLFVTGTRTYRQSVSVHQMRFRTQKVVDEMRAELLDAFLVSGANALDSISFQRPTPVEDTPGGELRYVDASYKIYKGNGELQQSGAGDDNLDQTDDGFPRITFQFVPLDPPAPISEAAEGFDLNNDGDRSDTFERGRLVRVVFGSDQAEVSRRDLTTDWVFKAQTPAGFTSTPTMADLEPFDLDNLDGNRDDPDPIFLIVNDQGQPDHGGQRLQIKVFTMEYIDGRPVLVYSEATVTPVNK